MTIAAPSFDYDDGLVHSHGWASSTPPGTDHLEGRLQRAPVRQPHDHVQRELSAD